VRATLKDKKIKYKLIDRAKVRKRHFKDKDIVITIGGDGTFLKTTHYVSAKTPMLGVNSNPDRKEGFFTACSCPKLCNMIDNLRSGKKKPIRLMRLEAYINKKLIPELSLNEVFVGRSNAYHTAKYTLKVRKKQELQRSSGIIISTPAGSSAWTYSAGGTRMPLSSRKFQLIVREPYHGRLSKKNIKKMVLGKKDCVELKAEMGNKVVVIDSLSKEYPLKLGDVLRVKPSNKDLLFVR